MDTLTIIKNKITELDPLYKRMDVTRDRVYNTPYTLMKFDNKTKMDNVVNVTLPYGLIFAHTVSMDLMGAYRQVVVKGNVSKTRETKVEQFLEDARDQADEGLSNKGLPSLFEWWCNHAVVRSFIGVRVITQIVDGRYKVDLLPLDMRYCPWEYGQDGLNWVCNITNRYVGQVLAEYPDATAMFSDSEKEGSNKVLEVKDYWDGDKNEVYAGDKLIHTAKNPFREPPFVIRAPATGFMLRDPGYLAHESEDLLYLLKDVYDEMNRSASIEQTLATNLINPAYLQEVIRGLWTNKPADQPPKAGQTKKTIKDEMDWKLLPVPDLNAAFQTARIDLQKVLQLGGVNDIDLGNVSQTVSAVWITVQSEIRRKFSAPRLKAIANCEQQLARKLIRQYQNASEEGEAQDILIGVGGRKNKYPPAQLGDPDKYTIAYELRTQSRTEEIANLAQYEAAPDLPTRWKLEHILKVDNPDGLMREITMEKAKRADPALDLFDMALAYAREGNLVEDENEANAMLLISKGLTERGTTIIRQRQQPVETAPPLPGKAQVPQVEESKGDTGLLAPYLGVKPLTAGRPAVKKEEVKVG